MLQSCQCMHVININLSFVCLIESLIKVVLL